MHHHISNWWMIWNTQMGDFYKRRIILLSTIIFVWRPCGIKCQNISTLELTYEILQVNLNSNCYQPDGLPDPLHSRGIEEAKNLLAQTWLPIKSSLFPIDRIKNICKNAKSTSVCCFLYQSECQKFNKFLNMAIAKFITLLYTLFSTHLFRVEKFSFSEPTFSHKI